MPKHTYSKNWPEIWSQTKESWEKIISLLQRLENNEVGTYLFSLNKFYCAEFKRGTRNASNHTVADCSNCPLFRDKYCFGESIRGKDTVFWKFLSNLKDSDKDGALELAEKMLARIMQDDPAKQKVCEMHGSIEHMQSVTGKCPACNKY